jgi:predicted ATPase/DNA-binding winged helix-turn-helix (wHTH) protein/uncharacterized protein Veg
MQAKDYKGFSFDEFEIDIAKRLLSKSGKAAKLNPKAFDLLVVLVENCGKVLSKNELLDTVWENQFVEENNLTVHISALRRLFGEKKGENRFIVTIPGRGYTFVAKVQRVEFQEQEATQNFKTSITKIPYTEQSLSSTEDTNSLNIKNSALGFTLSSNVFAEREFLIGREREIKEITKLLLREGAFLITLTGTGGTGKTRIAQAIAEKLQTNFPDGVYFVELASVTNSELVASTIAQTLGIKESGDESLINSLKNFLYEKRLLLILDNFEQLLTAAPLVNEFLKSSASLKILITSRAALQLNTEYELSVTPLDIPPLNSVLTIDELAKYSAVELFSMRARAVKSSFILTEETAPVIVEICRKLDGLPLAIELAAARIKLLSLLSILTRLENSLKLLAGGSKHLPPRQQTMRGTIEWSYQLLNEDEKTLFRRLAVFAGGFTVETAEAVCESYELQSVNGGLRKVKSKNQKSKLRIEVLDAITSLIDNNLLSQTDQIDGNARLRMLDVIREFALEYLEGCGESNFLQRSHALFFLSLAEKAELHLQGEHSVKWLEKLEAEIDNLRFALSWSLKNDNGIATRLAAAIRYFWIFRSHLTEGINWAKLALEQSGAAHYSLRFKLLSGQAILARLQGDYSTAQTLYKRGLEEGRAARDLQQIARANAGLGTVLQLQGNFAAAQKYYKEALAISRELNDEHGIAYALICLGIFARNENLADARLFLEESLGILRKFGNKEAISNNLNNLGGVAFDQGDFEAAHSYFTEALEMAQEVRNKVNIADAINGFAALAAKYGKPEQSAQLTGAAEILRKSIGYDQEPIERNFCENYTAEIQVALGEKDFSRAFRYGKTMNIEEAATLTKILKHTFITEPAQFSDEIVIESYSYSRILIEENIVGEEDKSEIPDEKIISSIQRFEE